MCNLTEKIGLGTAQIGMDYGVSNKIGQPSKESIRELLNIAKMKGIELLDTSPDYGKAEKLIGELVPNKFKVCSKCPSGVKKNELKFSLYKTLKSLKKSKLDYYLVHDPKDLLGPSGNDLWIELQRLSYLGLIEKIGVSIYSPKEAEILLSRYSIEIIQIPLNILDKRWHETGILKKLKEANVEIHVRSIFLQGALLMRKLPDRLSLYNHLVSDFQFWCEQQGMTPHKACLSYVLNQPEVDKVLIGVESTVQLKSALAAPFKYVDFPKELKTNDENFLNPGNW